jgi:transcriptional regulator GlxA family with amidase domain
MIVLDARRLVIVTFEGAQLLDVVGPLDVFSGANMLAGRGMYDLEVAAIGRSVRASCGLRISTTPLGTVDGPMHTLMVAGGIGEGLTDRPTVRLVREIARLAEVSERITSVCTGALLIAAAGLLDGKRATTHWIAADILQERHPEVQVDAGPIYIHDGDTWTSAGVTAGIDLALALVAFDHGEGLANDVARMLVLPGRRNGNQAQYAPQLAVGARDNSPLAGLVTWIAEHPTDDLTVAALADRAGYSERHLARVFKAEFAVTVAEHVQSVRLDVARRLLETTSLDLDGVARQCGFRHRETLHRHFERRLGTTPANYRRTFGHGSTGGD